VLEGTLNLLHPFMPFITDEIWHLMMNENEKGNIPISVLLNDYPKYEARCQNEAIEKEMELVKEVVVKVRNIKAEMNIQTKEVELVVLAPQSQEIIRRANDLILFLAKGSRITCISSTQEKPEQSASGVISDIQIFIPLKGLIDIDKEIERLKKEDEKTAQELARVKALLSNPKFTEKASPDAVEKERGREKELGEKKKIIAERLRELTG